MVNIAKLIARYVGRFIGLDLFSNKEWSCHADELFLMWKSPFIPFDTIYTGTICMPSEGILVAECVILLPIIAPLARLSALYRRG